LIDLLLQISECKELNHCRQKRKVSISTTLIAFLGAQNYFAAFASVVTPPIAVIFISGRSKGIVSTISL